MGYWKKSFSHGNEYVSRQTFFFKINPAKGGTKVGISDILLFHVQGKKQARENFP
jgi:hypothetical protein